MKKFLCGLLIAAAMLGLAACGKADDHPKEDETVETVSQLQTYRIYLPNDNADGFVVETACTAVISAEMVLHELKNREVLPAAVTVNGFRMDNGLITLDFNQAFADVVCAMGTSGELMIVGSVVNTFLDAFQAETVYFTVDGQILESGHTVYDFAMPFFSVEP